MAELPKLSEPARRKLDLEWEELSENHHFYLKLYATQQIRAEVRTGHLRTSYEITIRQHLIGKTISLAEIRFQQLTKEYLRLWASTEEARSKTFAAWLPEIRATTISEIAEIWATTDLFEAMFEHMRDKLEEHLGTLMQVWKFRVRRIEIRHLEFPYLSLALLVASDGESTKDVSMVANVLPGQTGRDERGKTADRTRDQREVPAGVQRNQAVKANVDSAQASGDDHRLDFASEAGRADAIGEYTKRWTTDSWTCSEASLARSARVDPADLSKWKKIRLVSPGSDKATRIENVLRNNQAPTPVGTDRPEI